VARIAGVDLPRNKRLEIALTYIYGIGKTTAKRILEETGLDPALRTDAMTEDHMARIRSVLERAIKVEGDLRREVGMNVKRLIDLNTYRGLRHRKGLPARGQRTRSNARTRKGPRRTVAGKKSVKTLK
jgi:small subunit ribosomal protein S13